MGSSVIGFLAFLFTVAGLWMTSAKNHKWRNLGYGLGLLSCFLWICLSFFLGSFWMGATNFVLAFVYAKGWFRTRPFARSETGW